ncbi:MAG: BtaA family protein [Balneolaceae bacterium]|nr:BtaA family protein [Balneolaceae bacterium]MBO6546503.1 BtaA family protein [Balneolaceae bacterium]MBO6648862.1 BtaA family protein [Balneolaceae bacterium]
MTGFLSKLWFNFIHSNFLVYNICWEDSDVDRHLLQINADTSLLTITSAGCNVLNYLLDNPKSVHCVDINPKQTALLDLKVALIKHGNYELFFSFFGDGKTEQFNSGYQQVRDSLSPVSKSFWDKHIHYFRPNGKGLFYHGGSGLFARFLNRAIDKKGIRKLVNQILCEDSKDQRKELLEEIKEKLWSGPEQNLWKSSFILSLAGVPKSQREAIGDINEFMKEVLYHIFVAQKPNNNYFWRVYLKGKFTQNCCPDYLKEKNFALLKSNIEKLHISTGGIHEFLETSTHNFTHVVLLDYMDWLVGHNESQLKKDWKRILSQTNTGPNILFRTAYANADFLPEFTLEKMNLEQIDPNWINQNDRVGTYTGTWVGKVL